MSIIGLNVNNRGTNLNDGISDEWNDSLLTVPINRVLSTDVNQKIIGTIKSISSIPDSLVLRDSFADATLTVGTPINDKDVANKLYVDTEVNAVQELSETAQLTAETALSNASTAQSTAETALSNASTAQSTANTALVNAATAQDTADDAFNNSQTARTIGETAQSDIDTHLTRHSNLIYYYIMMNHTLSLGVRPTNTTLGAANTMRNLNTASLVYHGDTARHVNPSIWGTDSNKYLKCIGVPTGKYRISYSAQLSVQTVDPFYICCVLNKNSAIYPNSSTGTVFVESLSGSGDNTIHHGTCVDTPAQNDVYMIGIACETASVVVAIYNLSFTVEELA